MFLVEMHERLGVGSGSEAMASGEKVAVSSR
jgi:hypothetical protein